jgi:hypothetical protein
MNIMDIKKARDIFAEIFRDCIKYKNLFARKTSTSSSTNENKTQKLEKGGKR